MHFQSQVQIDLQFGPFVQLYLVLTIPWISKEFQLGLGVLHKSIFCIFHQLVANLKHSIYLFFFQLFSWLVCLTDYCCLIWSVRYNVPQLKKKKKKRTCLFIPYIYSFYSWLVCGYCWLIQVSKIQCQKERNVPILPILFHCNKGLIIGQDRGGGAHICWILEL